MKLTARQHYASQVYLRAWGDEQEMLTAYDKKEGKQFPVSAKKICAEKYYYEDPFLPPNNELELKFGAYESAFGPTRDFLALVRNNAIELGQPVAEVLADALTHLPERALALKEFAGTAYFRTPGALQALREQLSADDHSDAAEALRALNSPYALSAQAFDSTLLQRFRTMHMVLAHSGEHRLDTGDWPCFPLAGGTGHSNFVYDIGRHDAAVALMVVSPNLAVMFLPRIRDEDPVVIPMEMPVELARQTNEMVHKFTHRFIIRG